MTFLYILTTKFGALVEDPGIPKVDAYGDTVKIVLQIIFGVIGAVAFLMMTLGGFKYVTSQGNPDKVSEAKNTILYAVIGMVIALVAFSIVTFVVGRLS